MGRATETVASKASTATHKNGAPGNTLLLAGRSDSNQVSVCLASAVSPAYCRQAALPNPHHPLLSKPTSISAHGSVQVLCAECAPKHLSNATRQVHKYINGAFAGRPPSVMFRGNGTWCILHTCRHSPPQNMCMYVYSGAKMVRGG